MKDYFDVDAWRQVVVSSLTEMGAKVAGFLPHLMGTLILVAVGWVVSRMLEAVARRMLQRLGVDRAAARMRVGEALGRTGITAVPSKIFSRLLFWTVMLTFVVSAVETLGLTAVTATIDRLITFLPNVVAAGLIALIGLLLGRFTRNLVGSGAAAADWTHARRVGNLAGNLVVAIVAVLALEQLGIETALLVTVVTVVVGAASLAVCLSFALGARPMVTHILAGHFLRRDLRAGTTLEVAGRRGKVDRVGPIKTFFRDGEHSWSVPNGTLIEETMIR